nr:N-glycosylase/DNA lyase [Sulfuracidifex metallicus]
MVQNVSLRARVLERAEEFKLNNKANNDVWIREFLLCQLTSNSSFVSAYSSLMCAWDFLLKGSYSEVAKSLKRCGYRFYNLKAKFIVNNREFLPKLKEIVKPIADADQLMARDLIANKFLGFGYKEASHFLRNVGYMDLAIVDRHVISFLRKEGTPINFKTLTRNKYLTVEAILRSISNTLNIELGILDLFIWFEETNTVLK